MQGWQAVVLVIACGAAVSVGVAVGDLASTGVQRPLAAGLGLVVAVFVNRVYAVVARRGQVVEGIDIAEAAIIALALILPPGEAVLTFVAASAVVELLADRARLKKAFNVSVRALGAGLLVVPVALVGHQSSLRPAQFVACVVGAVLYTTVNTAAVVAVIALVQKEPFRVGLREGLGARAVVWSLAVVVGLSSGYAALRAPWALPAMLALLWLTWLPAEAAHRAKRESGRLHHLLDASTRIQITDGIDEQEKVLLDVAQELFLWKDVSIRDEPPRDGERGAQVQAVDDRQRWLIATAREGSDPWSAEDDRAMRTLSAAASVAADRARLQAELARQALIDPLTGIANRRGFDETLARLSATGLGYSLVICDLDHFKSVNDRFGHDAGDDLLRIAAARLTASVRAGDVVARFGGDEFVVLLPGLTSRRALETVRGKVTAAFSEPVRIGRWEMSSLPCSLGAASAPRDGRTPREVLRSADRAMYDVKHEQQPGAATVTLALPDQRRGNRMVDVAERVGGSAP